MTNELLNEWKKEKIVEDGDIVLAGVSGGADSVCLLLMLEQLQKKTDFLLEAVHVEHGIRGEESRKDAAFVKNLCQDHGIRCHIFSVEVPVFAEKHGLGLEEAARILRYECYKKAAESVKKEFPEKKIRLALAHHAEDNAETVLFQMVRGSGLDGLCGMSRRRDEGIYELIRPLLAQPREEIEAFLKECGQSYCTDETNLDTEYSRNRIRHQVLPDTAALDHMDIYMRPLDEALEAIDETEVTQIIEKVLHLITSIKPNTISDYDFRLHYFLFRFEGMLESKQMLSETIHRELRDICFPDSLSSLNNELRVITSEAMRIASESRASTMGKTLLRIERYVNDNISSQAFSISALADYLNTNPSSLSVKYKKATGKKLIDYISEVRIQFAEQLLQQSSLTISDVAEKAGYGSVSTMYRAFKKYRGISPNAVRQGY